MQPIAGSASAESQQQGAANIASENWDTPGGPANNRSIPDPISAEAAAQYALVASADAASDEGLPVGLNTWLRNEPGYRISLRVEEFGAEQDALEMVLETAQHIAWWKSLSYFIAVQGGRGYGPEQRIETKDRLHRVAQILFLPDLTRYGVFEVWKGGFLGWGAFMGSLPINSYANRNRSIIFRVEED
jgi:hypothetical protein